MIDSITYMISRYCNLKCFHCLSSSGCMTDKDISNELDINKFIQFCDSIDSLRTIKITGGEPLSDKIYDKTYKLCKYAQSRGLNVQINTNGTFIPNDFDINPNLITLQVSLDGSNNIHNSIRGNGVFNNVISFIRTMARKNYRIYTMTVISDKNIFCLDELLFIIKSFGSDIKKANFQIISKTGRACNTELKINRNNIENKIRNNGYECRAELHYFDCFIKGNEGHSIGVDNIGNIIPCPYLERFKFGTISDFNESEVRKQILEKVDGYSCSYQGGDIK